MINVTLHTTITPWTCVSFIMCAQSTCAHGFQLVGSKWFIQNEGSHILYVWKCYIPLYWHTLGLVVAKCRCSHDVFTPVIWNNGCLITIHLHGLDDRGKQWVLPQVNEATKTKKRMIFWSTNFIMITCVLIICIIILFHLLLFQYSIEYCTISCSFSHWYCTICTARRPRKEWNISAADDKREPRSTHDNNVCLRQL